MRTASAMPNPSAPEEAKRTTKSESWEAWGTERWYGVGGAAPMGAERDCPFLRSMTDARMHCRFAIRESRILRSRSTDERHRAAEAPRGGAQDEAALAVDLALAL